jgi:putative transposase
VVSEPCVGIGAKYHANAAAEPVLAAWGITTEGKPVFVGLEAASSESGDA